MILDSVMLYSWWSRWFSSCSTCHVSFSIVMSSAVPRWFAPIAILEAWFPPWPPNGIVSNIVMDFCLLGYSLAWVDSVLGRYLLLFASSLSFSRQVANMILQASKLRLAVLVLAYFHRFKTIAAKLTPTVLAIVLSSCEEALGLESKNMQWDADSIQVVLDNSATTHIWSILEDFEPGSMQYFDDSENVGVMTIGSKESRPIGIGTVSFTLVDDTGTPRTTNLNNALYFPDSPVNICGVTCLAEQLNDHEGTWIQTRSRTSTFVWDHEKYKLTFLHPQSRLPMVPVNTGTTEYSSFCTMVDTMLNKPPLPMSLTPCRNHLPEDDMDDIRDVASDTSCISSSDTPVPLKFDFQESALLNYKVGDKLVLVKDGNARAVDVLSIQTDPENHTETYSVIQNDGHQLDVTQEFLRLPSDDVASIPVTLNQVQQHLPKLSPAELKALLHPVEQDYLLQRFMAWHDRSGHPPFSDMFQLLEQGIAPKEFLKLKGRKLICPSCAFAKAQRRKWGHNKNYGSLTDKSDAPGDRTSMDHVISAQPGLVPRIDGMHSKARITAGCVFIDHLSRLSYTHLQTSVDNKQTLEAKLGYERFAKSHGVTLQSFHSDSGVFVEKTFQDALDDTDQTITFCAVGAHHQNGLAEREIRTMTEGSRANLLHAQRRWPAAIGSILWPYASKDFENKKNKLKLDVHGRSALNRQP